VSANEEEKTAREVEISTLVNEKEVLERKVTLLNNTTESAISFAQTQGDDVKRLEKLIETEAGYHYTCAAQVQKLLGEKDKLIEETLKLREERDELTICHDKLTTHHEKLSTCHDELKVKTHEKLTVGINKRNRLRKMIVDLEVKVKDEEDGKKEAQEEKDVLFKDLEKEREENEKLKVDVTMYTARLVEDFENEKVRIKDEGKETKRVLMLLGKERDENGKLKAKVTRFTARLVEHEEDEKQLRKEVEGLRTKTEKQKELIGKYKERMNLLEELRVNLLEKLREERREREEEEKEEDEEDQREKGESRACITIDMPNDDDEIEVYPQGEKNVRVMMKEGTVVVEKKKRKRKDLSNYLSIRPSQMTKKTKVDHPQ